MSEYAEILVARNISNENEMFRRRKEKTQFCSMWAHMTNKHNKTPLGRWGDLGRSVVNTLGAMLSQTRFSFEISFENFNDFK